MTGNVCKWCGCAEIIRDGFPTINGGREVLFGCGSVWCEDTKVWYRDLLRCDGQVGRLYRRLADAVAALAAIERHEAGSDLGFEKISEDGEWVLFEDLKTVVDILEGKDSRESESEQ
jgi:hypothetical protein